MLLAQDRENHIYQISPRIGYSELPFEMTPIF